mgnify:CR=1 FL=1
MTEKKINHKTLRTQAKPYTSVPIELLTCDKAVIRETGEEVNVTDTVVRAYLYMRNNYCQSIDSGKDYFESWGSVANSIGRDVCVVKKGNNRIDKLLQKLGLVVVLEKKKSRSHLKIVRDIVDVKNDIIFKNSRIDLKEIPKPIEKTYVVYLQELVSPNVRAIKYGKSTISSDSRKKQQSSKSMFEQSVIKEWFFSTKAEMDYVESQIKIKLGGSFVKKMWMPDGFTETLPYTALNDIIDVVETIIS